MRDVAQMVGTALLGAALVLAAPLAVSAAHPDAWITTKAKMSLYTAEGVSGTAINVDTIDGVVTLHGKVASAAERTKAESTVRSIEGVKQVRNLLQVVEERRADAVKETDDNIKKRVQDALKTDKTMSDVKVQSVNGGVVLLAGNVETLSAHLRAIETAARVPGVRRVASEIESPDKLADAEIYSERGAGEPESGGRMSDMWITSAVKLRLMADDRTPGLGVNVDSNDGKVTLFGMVPNQQAKAAAEEDARKVSGVKTVVNDLQIVPSAQQEAVKESDDRLEEKVKDAISRQEDLRDTDIKVDVQNGVARLSGTVPSQEDRIRAAVTARSAAGVKAVRDDLRVAAK